MTSPQTHDTRTVSLDPNHESNAPYPYRVRNALHHLHCNNKDCWTMVGVNELRNHLEALTPAHLELYANKIGIQDRPKSQLPIKAYLIERIVETIFPQLQPSQPPKEHAVKPSEDSKVTYEWIMLSTFNLWSVKNFMHFERLLNRCSDVDLHNLVLREEMFGLVEELDRFKQVGHDGKVDMIVAEVRRRQLIEDDDRPPGWSDEIDRKLNLVLENQAHDHSKENAELRMQLDRCLRIMENMSVS